MRGCCSVALAALLACACAAGAARANGRGEDRRAVELMARNMYFEAKGEGRGGMLAVGWVVLNRLADRSFPKTVDGIVTQDGQFGWTSDDQPDEPTDARAWRVALGLAERLLGDDPPADPTRGSISFHHADDEAPGWGSAVAPAARVGNHLFYARAERLPRPALKPWRALQVAQR